MLSTFRNALDSGITKPLAWLIEFVSGGQETVSGIRVSTTSALGYPPVWYAVNKIAGNIGQLPMTLRKRLKRGSDPAKEHPAYRLVKTRPNSYQTPIVFFEQMMAHALLMGNGRAVIIRDTAGNPIELLPMAPDRTVTCFVEGEKWHATTVDIDDPIEAEMSTKTQYYKFPDRDVLHIMGLSMNGMEGESLIKIARETIGNGLGGQKATGKNFRSSKPGLMIEVPRGAFRNDQEAQEFIDNFNTAHEGLDNAGKTGMIRDGMKVHSFPVSARDAEWLDQRRFERQDTALLFQLESILGDDSSVSYNSLEEKNLAFLVNCLMRWIIKWEQECNVKLLTQRQIDRDSHYFKFNVSALLRANSKTQMDTIIGYITARVYSPNEARELLDMNPYEGGDSYENPNTMSGKGAGESDDESDSRTKETEDEKSQTV